MEDHDGLPSSQPAWLSTGEKSDEFQTLVHATISSIKGIKGRAPIIVPVSKKSPFGLYANLNIRASVLENPWDIIRSVSRRQTDSVDFCLPPASTKQGNIWPPQQTKSEERHAGIKKRLHSNAYNLRRGRLPPSGKNPADTVGRQRQLIVFGANTASGFSHALRDKSIRTHRVPRAPHFLKFYMRVFSWEIQNIMHGFGEVRYCSANVLEFVEDTVRSITQRVALGILSRFSTETLTVSNISTCIRRDPNALYRLLFCLRRARLHGEDLHVVRPIHRDWDSFLHHATIHGIKVGDSPSLKVLEHIPVVKVHNKCTELARSTFWSVLGVLFKLQHNQGIQSSLTDRESRCPAKEVGGRRRIDLFREWLALPDYVQMTEGSLHALGNLTREAIGILTQAALVLRQRNEAFHSYEKLLVVGLGYGIGAGVTLPLSGLQTFELLSILEDMENTTREKEQWSIQGGRTSEALQMKYMREAWRQLDDPAALAAHRPFWYGM